MKKASCKAGLSLDYSGAKYIIAEGLHTLAAAASSFWKFLSYTLIFSYSTIN